MGCSTADTSETEFLPVTCRSYWPNKCQKTWKARTRLCQACPRETPQDSLTSPYEWSIGPCSKINLMSSFRQCMPESCTAPWACGSRDWTAGTWQSPKQSTNLQSAFTVLVSVDSQLQWSESSGDALTQPKSPRTPHVTFYCGRMTKPRRQGAIPSPCRSCPSNSNSTGANEAGSEQCRGHRQLPCHHCRHWVPGHQLQGLSYQNKVWDITATCKLSPICSPSSWPAVEPLGSPSLSYSW